MSDEIAGRSGANEPADDELRGAVIVGLVPGQSARVVREAANFARMFGVRLVVVHVDVTRFVTYQDPDGYMHTAPIDLQLDRGDAEFDQVRALAADVLAGGGVKWTPRKLVGDPAIAIKQLAERIDAKLIVIGTRKPGFGETIREFFTGSVAARLAHRQSRNVLVVPLGEPLADDAPFFPEG